MSPEEEGRQRNEMFKKSPPPTRPTPPSVPSDCALAVGEGNGAVEGYVKKVALSSFATLFWLDCADDPQPTVPFSAICKLQEKLLLRAVLAPRPRLRVVWYQGAMDSRQLGGDKGGYSVKARPVQFIEVCDATEGSFA